MKALRLSDSFSIPPEAVTQTFGILSVRGAGKSNCAAVMAEGMFAAHLPFVVVDPVGSWYGLRSSADGQEPGLPIPIFGGRHGDVPLERGAGQLIADLIVDERLSCVLDVSEFSEGDKIRFLTDAAERLYRRNEDPLHLFLEESDDYLPQRPFREQARCLRSWENIVRRGRARGLGITMISQRSAAINKNVLTQIETLIVLRTTSPQDRKAIEAWVEYHGQSRELLESLPGLKDGEAWVWSPHWLHTLKRVQIRRRTTFDSAATPKEIKGKRPPATLADVDLPAVQKRMAETIERAKQEDPRELRRQVADLRAQLAQAHKSQPARPEPKPIEIPVVTDGQIARLEKVVGRLDAVRDRFAQAQQIVVTEVGLLREALGKAARSGQASARLLQPTSVVPSKRSRSGPQLPAPSAAGLDGVQQRILDTLATLELRGLTPTREAVARWMGIHPNGGRFNKSLALLRQSGLLDGWQLTAQGRSSARAMPTGPDAALGALKEESQRTVLRTVLQAGRPLSKEALAENLGIHPNGGRFNHTLAWFRDMGIIPERGSIQPTPGLLR